MLELKLALRYARYVLAALATLGFWEGMNYRRTTMLELKLALRYARYVLAALATLGFWDFAN